MSKFLKIFNFPITIAAFQCLIAAILSTIPAVSIEFVSLKLLTLEARELIYAGVLSSGIAFLLQIIALQHLSPAPAAIIFSLEGVFASIAAWLLLDQYLNEFKVLGIIIILSAVIFSQLAPIYGKKKYMDETKKGFIQNIGDLSFKKIDETNYEFSIKVEEKFLNTGKIAHGGFIATIADTGMGNAAHIAAGNKRSLLLI